MTTPSGATPGGGDGKKGGRNRMNNIIPVNIKDLLEFDGETFTVEGLEAGMVVIVGQVKSIDNQATKTTYRIEDNTGAIDAVLWIDENKEPSSDVSESIYVRVVGGVRTNQDKKYILAYKISPTSGAAENDGHLLDVVYARYKIKELRDKEDMAAGIGGGGGGGAGLTNSMMGGFGGGSSSSSMAGSGGGQSFGNAKQDLVYKMVSACTRDEGLQRDEVAQQLSGKMNKKEVNDALDYLSGEGHIYSTIDDDHFKAIDS